MAFLAGGVLLGLAAWAIGVGFGDYPVDDAYAVEHAVAGILSGHESRFVGSTPWQGVTSPIYVASVALLSVLLPIPAAHWAVSALAVLSLAGGVYALCLRHAVNPWTAAAVVLFTLLAGTSLYQLANGLETGMAMAVVAWVLVAFDHDRPRLWGYALAGAAPFVRPELAALAAICLAHAAIARRPGWARGVAAAAAAFAVVVLALVALGGSGLPNTAAAKAHFFAEGCLPIAVKASIAAQAVAAFVGGLGLFSLGFLMAAAARLRVVIALFVAVFLLAYVVELPGALFHNSARYLYVLLPIAALGWAACLGHRVERVRYASAAAGVIGAAAILLSAGRAVGFYRGELQAFARDNAAAAEWVAANVPTDSVVMVHDAGRISLAGAQPLVDLVGLKSPRSADVHRRTTYAQCRRVPEAISEIAAAAGASYVVVFSGWDGIFRLIESLRATGWAVERVDTQRGESPYKVYRILRPGTEVAG